MNELRICVIGLGYVGRPLAEALAKHHVVQGFDTNPNKSTLADVPSATREENLCSADVYIVAVPTPVGEDKVPDLDPLKAACETVGRAMKPGATVIFESTVFPGCTEEVCVPILEQVSGLTYNEGFTVGYSPERVSPGDDQRQLTGVVKVTAGSTPEAAEFVDRFYRRIITAGTHKAPSIRVAEACKVVENIQRDVNIALMNELAKVFKALDIDTQAVLEAAGTKWNFHDYRPGLVGGHCIGVDPYYLLSQARRNGVEPRLIAEARHVNERMAHHVADDVVRLMTMKRIPLMYAPILVLGASFKANCPDLRNTKVLDLVKRLRIYGAHVDIYDPVVDAQECEDAFGVAPMLPPFDDEWYSAIVVAVDHFEFKHLDFDKLMLWGTPDCVIYDLTGRIEYADGRL